MKHHAPISGVATYKNLVATTGYDNQVILWDAMNRRALARSLHDHLANQCSFSHDGTMLVSASSDYSARIWAIPTMQLKVALVGHADDVDMAVFSPDDALIATCALDRTLKIFDLNGQCLKTMTGHTGNVLSVAWSGDGKSLISSSVDGTVRQWDVATGAQINCTDEGARTDTFAMSNEGYIFSGDDRGRIAVIDEKDTRYIDAHKAGIKKLLLKEDERLLVTISYDRSIAIWRISPPDRGAVELTELSRSILPASIWARAADFLSDSRIILGTFGATYAIFDWRLGRWDVTDIEPSKSLNAVAAVDGDLYSVGDAGVVYKNGVKRSEMGSLCNFLLPVGGWLLTGGQLGILFDALTGRTLYEHHSPLNCGTSFYRNGQLHIAIGTYTGEVLIFAISQDGHLQFADCKKIYENAVKGLTGNDQTIFSVCANTSVAWLDIASLEVIDLIQNAHDRIANGCCRIGDSGFASIGRDLKLILWTNGLREVYQTPHKNSVKCICASDNGERIVTGSYGGTLAYFNVVTRQWTSFSRPTAAGISAIAYDATRDQFVASSYDGQLYAIDEALR